MSPSDEPNREADSFIGRLMRRLPQGLVLGGLREMPNQRRQVAMYLAKEIGGWSTTQIGRYYNGRDHSTVCYALRRIEALRETPIRMWTEWTECPSGS
jgi:hypothetical protein